MILEFSVPGEACAQGRPRFTVFKNRAFAYDPEKSKNYKSFVKLLAMQAMEEQGWKYNELPLAIEIMVYKAIPKRKTKKIREAIMAGKEYPTVKPDVDNVAKTIMDALSGVVYKDDKQVVDLSIKKRYTETEPLVMVTIEVL